ncbi:DUF4040 family protein [Corynebacterium lubricantis]|uniref:DUF4040 family protein n=1 Tax=Corynebacterium lubricantis TaxID=541095 RepID=UPI00037A5064|nr:DUF4040 family protein [Corynebacterium lubricantis]
MLFILLAVLGITVALAPMITRMLGRNAGWLLAVPLVASAVMGVMSYVSPRSGNVHEESVSWIPSLGVDFAARIDGLSLVFLLLVLIIGAGVLMYSTRYLHEGKASFYMLICGFALAMSALVLTDDLVVFYIAWEMTTLCSFFLIANGGEKGYEPAIRTLLVTVAGGLLLLTATVIMVITTGTTQLSAVIADPVWQENTGLTTAVACLVAGAAFTKSAQFPFQAWLPDSMVAIAPVSAYLHAAAMVKAGIYLILRYSPMFEGIGIWNVLLISSGLFTALFGAMTAVKQNDLKALLAYSTMSQLGLLVAVVGIGTKEALTAAIVHTIAHATFKATLFMSVGIVEHETGTRDFNELRTLRVKMPVTQTIVVISAASMAGIPPLAGFVSKEMLLGAGLSAPFGDATMTLITGAIVVTSIFTFAYSYRYILGVLGNRTGDDKIPVKGEAAPTFYIIPAILTVVTVLVGLYPQMLNSAVADAALAATGEVLDPHLALWHGFNLPLALSALIIVCGSVLAWRRWAVAAFLSDYRAPVTGIEVVEAFRSGTIAFGARFTAATGTTSQRRHLAAPLLGLVVIGVIGLFTLNDIPAPVGPRYEPADWVLLLIVAVGVASSLKAQSRVTLAIVVGIVGFGTTLWFFNLGAADVATTQLTVEILTVVVMVMILHRLPDRFPRERRSSILSSAVLAVAVGVTSMLAVMALTGRREKTDAAEYYLREGPIATGGDNIVNTILVEFRAFDTLGELTVLGVAGIAVVVLLRARPLRPRAKARLNIFSPVYSARNNSVFLRSASRLVLPLIVVISVVLFFRGHNATGGGFVAALVGAAGFAMLYLMAASDQEAKVKWPYMSLIGSGIFIGAATGLLGYFEGSYLTPLSTYVFGIHLTTSLIFDLGVYLAVLGVILASINLAGIPTDDPGEPEDGAPEAGQGDVGVVVDGKEIAQPAERSNA